MVKDTRTQRVVKKTIDRDPKYVFHLPNVQDSLLGVQQSQQFTQTWPQNLKWMGNTDYPTFEKIRFFTFWIAWSDRARREFSNALIHASGGPFHPMFAAFFVFVFFDFRHHFFAALSDHHRNVTASLQYCELEDLRPRYIESASAVATACNFLSCCFRRMGLKRCWHVMKNVQKPMNYDTDQDGGRGGLPVEIWFLGSCVLSFCCFCFAFENDRFFKMCIMHNKYIFSDSLLPRIW